MMYDESNGPTYHMVLLGVVAIYDPLLDLEINLDRENLLRCLTHAKDSRHEYDNDKAQQRAVDKFQGALAFLDSQEAAR